LGGIVAGRNRYYAPTGNLVFEKSQAAAIKGPCVFISHKREDIDMARLAAKSLKQLEIDVWLDVDDQHTQQAAELNDDKKLAEAIERGLVHCTHLLALLSPKTKGSWWVPYEIGSARGRQKDLAFLVHKDVKELPSYLIFGRKLLDQYDFYKWAESISSLQILTEARVSVQKSSSLLNTILPPFRHA
jgi:hypothetical protein